MYACASSLAVLPVASPSASVVVPIPNVRTWQADISLRHLPHRTSNTFTQKLISTFSVSFPRINCCLPFAAWTFLRPLPSTTPVLSTFHTSSITRPSLATQSWDCRVTYTAMLLPGSPVSFPLRAWPRPRRLQDLSQSSLHKGVSRSAAVVGPHGSSRGRTSVRKQGDPDRLQSRRLSNSVKPRALVRCFDPPPCVKASRARRARA